MINTTKEEDMASPIQEILFGSPGTGKSWRIDNDIISNPNRLNIDVKNKPQNVIKAVFHPEYTYGDFIGKLLPITKGATVKYNYYEGHFLRALTQAYKNLMNAEKDGKAADNVVLVIDEINRGNSAAIFGSIFQLLDRDDDGWSSYAISISDMEFIKILELLNIPITYNGFDSIEISALRLQLATYKSFDFGLVNKKIKIPPNLSILATMNTSDSSIYYMDSAFKRRWDWTFITPESETIEKEGIAFYNKDEWIKFISKLNTFIKANHKHIRGIEDKQIGRYFIKGEIIKKSSIQNKLMFFIWDSVFSRDKSPLIKLLNGNQSNHNLVTFGDFAKDVDNFIAKIKSFKI